MSDRLRGDGRKTSRRQWLKTTGGLTLAAAGSQLGCAATGDGRDEAPVDLRNPEKQAGTHRIKHYLRRCRELALAELKPTQKQIDRALELHEQTLVCDPMGGSLPAGGLYSPPDPQPHAFGTGTPVPRRLGENRVQIH